MTRSTHIQFGCGFDAAASWRNFDASPSLKLQRLPVVGPALVSLKMTPRFPPGVEYGDIVRGLPVAPGSADAIFSSHVLEHLARNDCMVALQRTLMLLRPGGVFRLVLPDLRALADAYVNCGLPDSADRFMDRSFLGKRERSRGLRSIVHAAFGNSAHLWMWDAVSLADALRRSGFVAVRQASLGDADDRLFDLVERADRFTEEPFAESGPRLMCLALEARRQD